MAFIPLTSVTGLLCPGLLQLSWAL